MNNMRLLITGSEFPKKLSIARKIIEKRSSAQQNFSHTITHMLTIHALRFRSLFFQIRIPPTHMRGLT